MRLDEEIAKQVEQYRDDPDYQAEMLILRVTEEISRLMERNGVSKADLARRLGVSKARVTQILNGSPNLTVRTIAAIATALGAETTMAIRAWRPPNRHSSIPVSIISLPSTPPGSSAMIDSVVRERPSSSEATGGRNPGKRERSPRRHPR